MEEEKKKTHQCVSCGRWFEEHEMFGEVCADCHVAVIEDEDAG
jgi:hypothetical protein